MVVCKCRKATKLYCFVHKVPVCGECICFTEHQICVVNAYAQWVIDGDYDWPPKCSLCQAVLAEGTEPQTTRLGCLHVIHTSCLVSHIKSYPLHTAPPGYVCPACPTPIWPPKNFKDTGSQLHARLKEAIFQTGLEKSLFGNYSMPQTEVQSQSPPHAFAGGPLVHSSTNGEYFEKDDATSTTRTETSNLEISGQTVGTFSLTNDEGNFIKSTSPGSGATTRKSAVQTEKINSDISYYAGDEDRDRKYSRRGSFQNKFLRTLLPFWLNPAPILPVTATPRKEFSHADDASDSRSRQHRSKRMDPRKLLLVIAIMACLTTMGILYYRIAQRSLNNEVPDDGRE